MIAARLGRALGPDAASALFSDLFAHQITPEAAAEKAAAALSIALDVGALAAQLSALQGIILAADAVENMDGAIDFGPPLAPGAVVLSGEQYAEYVALLGAAARPGAPVPLLSPSTEAGFAALERTAQGEGDPSGG